MSKNTSGGCETCSNYVYDEDYGYYVCEANMDEDELVRFLSSEKFNCPYYHLDDEYRTHYDGNRPVGLYLWI